MSIDAVLVAVVGLALGYMFLVLLLVLPGRLTQEGLAVLKGGSLPLTRGILRVASYALTVLVFFGIAEVWIMLLAKGDWARNLELARIWGQWWFIGFVVSCLIPVIERRFRRTPPR